MQRPPAPRALRSAAWRVAPALIAERHVRYERRLAEQEGRTAEGRAFAASHGDRVLRGPLQGAPYHADGDAAIAKLAGAYEAELQRWLADALAHGPARFVDIGAADGYYAVGVAATGVATVAFELSSTQRARMRELAQRAGVAVEIHPNATPSTVAALSLEHALILMDVDGAEVSILDGQLVPRLATATLLLEVHERTAPGTEATLRKRFAASHSFEVVDLGARDPADYPEVIASLGEAGAAAALSESMRTDGHRFARIRPL